MRIGLVIYGSLDTVSGGYLYNRKLVEHLRASGHEVEVIALRWRSYALRLADNFSPKLLSRLRHTPFDVLLQDELNHPSLFLLNRRLRPHSGYAIVSIVHHLRTSERHPPILRAFYRWIEQSFLRSIGAFVYNSQTTRRVVESLLGASPPHVVALPSGSRFSGIPADLIAKRAAETRPLRIVFLGNLIPRKGLHTLLDALARIPNEAAHLTIIGATSVDPGYVRSIRRRIASLDLGGRVEVSGKLADGALIDRLSASDVMAVPSTYEGFGIVYLEGMAFGLPAIGTAAGGAGEIITPGIDGFLVPPDDAERLAGWIQLLAFDRSRLRDMSLAARRRFDAHPSWDHSTGRVEAFLNALTAWRAGT